MESVKCPSCSFKISGEAMFCPRCSAKIVREPQEAEWTIWRGRYSGKSLIGTWLLLGVTTIAVTLLMLLLVSTVTVFRERSNVVWMVFAVVLALALIASGLTHLYRSVSRQYELTSHRIIVRKGILEPSMTSIDLRNIEDMLCTQRLIERFFGVGSIIIVAQEVEGNRLLISGLDNVGSVYDLIDSVRRKLRACRSLALIDGDTRSESRGDTKTGDSLSDSTPTSRGLFASDGEVKRDLVDCAVFAPPEASIPDTVLVQVFVHLPDQAETVAAAAAEFDDEAKKRGATSLATEIEKGTILAFNLEMPRLIVDEPEQELVWRGTSCSVQFEVKIPSTAASGNVIGKLIVLQGAVPIGKIKFKLKLVTGKGATTRGATTGDAVRYLQAFISYASQDRPEVLQRVQMLSAAGIRCFQDVLSLDPGDRWQKELYRHIDNSDVMFLFWSSAAKESAWVAREWQYGLDRKGDDFIYPVVIEGPPPVPPPKELRHLHFNDKILYFIAGSSLGNG